MVAVNIAVSDAQISYYLTPTDESLPLSSYIKWESCGIAFRLP